ncbi:tyrosine-type recombinase/integrase [Streptomyces sp. NPDC088261]|uniref:tyrosine-type recombinase/integrase n=1 Tax=Streptomyces sp. NPDC088261 TaxID=3365851 RepID=UPI0037F4163D
MPRAGGGSDGNRRRHRRRRLLVPVGPGPSGTRWRGCCAATSRRPRPRPGTVLPATAGVFRAETRPLIAERILAAGPDPHARLFTGPRGGRISTAVLRDATHWDDVVTSLGHEHLRRHDLRHTGLTWFADADVPAHVLRRIAGHGSLLTTQRYLHPDMSQITHADTTLTAHLNPIHAPPHPHRPTRPRTPAEAYWPPADPQERRKGGIGFLRYRLRPAEKQVGTTGFEPATP